MTWNCREISLVLDFRIAAVFSSAVCQLSEMATCCCPTPSPKSSKSTAPSDGFCRECCVNSRSPGAFDTCCRGCICCLTWCGHFRSANSRLLASFGSCAHSTDSNHLTCLSPCTFDCCVMFLARCVCKTCTIHRRRSHRRSAALPAESESHQCCFWNVPIQQIVPAVLRGSAACCLSS